MANNQGEDDATSLIRFLLNKERIKLWLPPYTLEDGTKGMYPEGMVNRYATELRLDSEIVASRLEQLRKHSVEKLAARLKFKETGITALAVKIVGKLDLETNIEHPVEVSLQIMGSELKDKVSSIANVQPDRLKLIGCGHVIVNNRSLLDQHIRPDSQIMAIVLSESEAESQMQQDEQKRLGEARQDAEIISSNLGDQMGDENFYLQIADQSGNPISLPKLESKALALAMTLHEKGRAALRRKEYAYALLLLLEADEEFSKCRSSLLTSVDNYALLCLDITWCYLCLQSVTHLPDAESRLRTCEECFHRSYGSSLERVAALKGNTVNEQCLLMRLHLLQGIMAFHKKEINKSKEFLAKAENELKDLKIDDEKLSQMLTFGYQPTESRLALRSAHGNIEMAVSLIIQKKEEQEKIKMKELQERKKKKRARGLGKVINGEWMNVDMFDNLIAMGFSKTTTKEALRQSNNNVSLAIQMIHENPDLLRLEEAGPSGLQISDVQLAQVTSLGFDLDNARKALEKVNGDIFQAAELLGLCGGIMPMTSPSSSGTLSSSNSDSSVEVKTPEELERQQQAMERIREDLQDDDEAHLDLTLEEELTFLEEYKVLLARMML